jgi:hypothetical protein
MLQPGSSFIALQVVCFKEQRIDVLKKKKQRAKGTEYLYRDEDG